MFDFDVVVTLLRLMRPGLVTTCHEVGDELDGRYAPYTVSTVRGYSQLEVEQNIVGSTEERRWSEGREEPVVKESRKGASGPERRTVGGYR